jgi:hypothetical protein
MENETIEPVVLTTTLYSLRKHHACEARYSHLVGALGPDWGDKTPINLLAILEHNVTDDCLWALCSTNQNCDQVARLMAAEFAEMVLPIYERQYPGNNRPRATIQAALDYAHSRIGDIARDAARDAAGDSGDAWDAAWEATGEARAKIIRRYLREVI